jgi:capsid protein
MRMIYARFGLPYDIGQMDFQKGSFAQSKAALTMAYQTFQAWQIWLRDSLMQRLWNWTIARGINDGFLPPAPMDARGFSTWYKVDWSFPGREWIDPQDAVQAEMAEYRLGKTSLASIVKKTGRDYEDVLLEKAGEMLYAKRLEEAYKLPPGSLINAFTNAQAPIENNGRPPNRDNANEP